MNKPISNLMGTAQTVGFQTRWINIKEFGWGSQNQVFVSRRNAFRPAAASQGL